MQVDSIAEQLFFTTLRIETGYADGSSGSGTAFFFAMTRGDKSYPFIVTNKHVVDGATTGAFTFTKRVGEKPMVGERFRVDLTDWPTAWFGHPDPEVDIAVMPTYRLLNEIRRTSGVEVFMRHVVPEMIPSELQLLSLDAIEEVTFIGYPNGIWDGKNLLPVARRGTTASPIQVDFEGAPKFVIDASVFGGSSGSPVFIYSQGMFTTKSGMTSIAPRLLFVGVITSVFYKTDRNEIVAMPIPTNSRSFVEQKEMLDLGIVAKARTVVEAVNACLSANGVPDSI